MEHLNFSLEIEDDWPPIGVECMPYTVVDGGIRIEASPFFIKNLALGDVISAIPDKESKLVFDWDEVEYSHNSTVWVASTTDCEAASCIEKLRGLGCGISNLEQFSLHSINIPASMDTKKIDECLEKYEKLGLAIAYPAWRHEE